MKKLALIVLLIIGLSFYTISAIANENFMLYCHKETGECFSPKKETNTTLEYFENRNIQNYETIFLNIKPVMKIKETEGLTEEEKNKFIPLPQAGLEILIQLHKDRLYNYKLFHQIERYPNGNKKTEYTGYGLFKSLIKYPHGKHTEWYESGKKKMKVDYKYGEIDGKITIWYENGFKKQDQPVRHDKLHGLSKLYDSQGVLIYKDTYENDEKINRKAYNAEGKLKFDQDY